MKLGIFLSFHAFNSAIKLPVGQLVVSYSKRLKDINIKLGNHDKVQFYILQAIFLGLCTILSYNFCLDRLVIVGTVFGLCFA